jgi:predicted Zn-dependent protease
MRPVPGATTLRRWRVLLLCGIAAAPLAACGPQHALPNPGRSDLAAAQRTIAQAGPLDRENRSVDQQVAMLARVARRVEQASEPLCREYLGESCDFRVALARSDEVNAFASEGPTVTVTSGMMQVVDDDDELAAVVAHEIGHHLANHLQRAGARTQLGSLAGALIGAYFGGDALAQAGAQLGGGAARLAYSQAEESEADYLAAFMVHRAGYDLDKAGQIWIRLAQSAGGPERPSLLSTHPTGPQRLASWQQTVREIRSAPRDAMPRRS